MPPPRESGSSQGAPFWEVLWHRRWIVTLSVVLALTGAAVYLARAVPVYASTSQLYIEQSRPKIMGDSLLTVDTSANYLLTQCELIRSSAVLSEALGSPAVQEVQSLGTGENRVGVLKSMLGVQVGKQGDIISVVLESTRPADAAALVNAVVEAYIAQHNRKHRSTAGDVLKIFQAERKQYEAESKAYAQKMLKFQQDNGTISMEGKGGNIVIESLVELSNVLTKAKLETLDAKLTMESANAMKGDPARLQQFLTTLSDKVLSEAGAARGGTVPEADSLPLRQRIAVARARLGPNHPEVELLTRQLRQMENEQNQIQSQTSAAQQAALASQLAIIREQYSKAQRREEAIQKNYDVQLQKATDLNAKLVEFGQLAAGAKRAGEQLDLMDRRIKDIRLDSENADTFNSISILETAKIEPKPVRPNRPQVLAMGLVIGLMVGVGVALVRDWTDQRLRSAEEIASLLELPVLGTIPHILGKQTPAERGQEIHLHPRSDVAEAYRTIRTAIYFGVPDADSKTILVTSPSPGDGKSTVTSNLALAIAQANRRVLLIDADCRKPVQHRAFGITQELGVSSVLLGHATAEAAIQKTGADNLDILPCGPLPTNPAEMLNSQAFVDLIAELSLKYDQIVIDSPPVVPVTDARILAASCDVTVLVLRADKSTRRLSEHARDVLAGVGGNTLGVVVNDVPRGRGKYGYYYSGYGYYYGYGYGPRDQPAETNGDGHVRQVNAITVTSTSVDEDAPTRA